jgi:hypothetical protein
MMTMSPMISARDAVATVKYGVHQTTSSTLAT